MLAFAMLVIGALVLLVVLVMMLRSFTRAEARTETELSTPGTPTLRYAVPNGQDPAVLVAALSHEGYRSIGELVGGTEVLLVECLHAEDRARVRSIIEHVHRTAFEADNAFEGEPLPVGHVSFEDER